MSNDFGWQDQVDPSVYANVGNPTGPSEPVSTFNQDYFSPPSRTLYYHPYSKTSHPVAVRPKIFDDNGYFMNGPSSMPFTRALSDFQYINAHAESFINDGSTVGQFSDLVSQYGHTNSAGVLWSLARLGMIDPNRPEIQQILKMDAQEHLNETRSSQPVTASSPVANEGVPEPSFMETIATPFEFAARNAFAALQMPVEAIQGAVRGIGGALTNETPEGADFHQGKTGTTLAYLGSLAFPLMSYWAENLRGGDNQFINPWEQTEFGQTIEAAINGAGFDAFTSMQAGVDANKASDELAQTDPNWANYSPLQQAAIAQQYARDKGYYSRPGWFVDETSRVGEAQRRATFDTWAIPGPDNELTAWTLGRGIFSNVGGPDWEGYSVASGIVDAAALIFMDPITYLPAVGLPSKAAAALTGGKFKFGRALKDFQSKESNFINNIRSAQKIAADGDNEAAARLIYPDLKEYLGRAPTQQELKDAVNGVTFPVDPRDLKEQDIEAAAQMTRSSREAEVTALYMRGASVDRDAVVPEVVTARRSALSADRTDQWLAKNVRPTGGGAEARQLSDEWNNFTDFITEGGDQIVSGRYTDFAITMGDNEPALSRLLAMQDMYDQFRAIGQLPDNAQTMRDFGSILEDAASDTRSIRPSKDVPTEVLGRDAARIFATRDDADAVLTQLESRDLHGVILENVPTAESPVLGTLDSSGGLFYFAGTKNSPIRTVAASQIVDPVERRRIVTALRALLDREDMKLSDTGSHLIDFDSVGGQMYRKVDMLTDSRGAIEALMEDATTTYAKLLDVSAAHGLDAALDEILRGGKGQFKVDGITDVDGVIGRTWIGDSSKVKGYVINEDVKVAGAGVRGLEDIDSGLAQLQLPQIENVSLGRWGMTPGELEAISAVARSKSAQAWDNVDGYRADAMFRGFRQDFQLDEALRRIDEEWSDPIRKFKSTMGWHAGMRSNPVTGMTLDEKGVRAFLFGMGPFSAFGGKVLETLSDFIPENMRVNALEKGVGSKEYEDLLTDATGQIMMVTGRKWTPELAVQVAENAINGGGKNGLIDILAPRLGVEVKQGSLSRTIRPNSGDQKTFFRTARSVSPVAARMMGQMPTARKVNLDDPLDAIDNILLYGRYAGLDESFLATQIGRISRAGGMERTAVVRNAFTETFNAISTKLIENIETSGTTKVLFKGAGGQKRKEEIIRKIKESTTLYINGQLKDIREQRERLAHNAGQQDLVLSDGYKYVQPSLSLETEVADGFLGLPSVDEWADGLSRITRAIDRFALTGGAWKSALKLYDDFFRTSLLVFRGAYVIRNLAEMQVRMFFNGHESMFSDPSTLFAMTVLDERYGRRLAKYQTQFDSAARSLKGKLGRDATEEEIRAVVGQAPQQSRLVRSFDRYRNTILDTTFNTGMDAQLAAAHSVEDFFERIRLAHSLTDPRVYSSGIRQGWREAEYGSLQFTGGWANELIMLERSGVARLVAGKPGTEQFESLVGGTLTVNAQRQIANSLMHDPAYEGTRRVLISADEEYAKILANEDAVMEYLFLGQNSIFNRIKTYTNGDKSLLDYIRTGNLEYAPGQVLKPRSYSDPKKKITDFRSVLDRYYSGKSWEEHFKSNNIKVPFLENIGGNDGNFVRKAVDWFFEVSNKIERLGAVAPEYRMAYWDKMAEIAPMLRGAEVGRALEAARTTLSPIQNMTGLAIGKTHPAWQALKQAQKNGSDGYLGLDDLHKIASAHAAEVVGDLFYDAAKRNNLWWQLRLIFPFGQAHGNTLAKWSELGAKNPIQIYKVQRLFNALQEEGSNAIYEAGQSLGVASAYGQAAPGFNPWEKDGSGGFFYQNDQGDTTFVFPWTGRAVGAATNVLARINGVKMGMAPWNMDIPIESGAKSLNLALGGDSIAPGISPFGSFMLSSEPLQDNTVASKARQVFMPFGDRSFTESATSAFAQKLIGGVGAIPIVGSPLSNLTSNMYPMQKNKHITDALAILSTSGNYPNFATDNVVADRMLRDAQSLAAALLLTTGMAQNVMPSAPMVSPNIDLGGDKIQGVKEGATTTQYSLAILNMLFQQYRTRHPGDETAAKEEWVKDFGPAGLFAVIGDWNSFTRVPTSQALDWARKNPEAAAANLDIFPYFFPQGDSSDVEAQRWLRNNAFDERIRKNPQEVFDEVISYLQRIQKARVNSMEAAEILTADQAEAARNDIDNRYLRTADATVVAVDKTKRLEQFNAFVQDNESVKNSDAGIAFQTAWATRAAALERVRALTGDPNSGLGSQIAKPVFAVYSQEIDRILSEHPDFRVLAPYFKREWV
jgi:hypothetical protein